MKFTTNDLKLLLKANFNGKVPNINDLLKFCTENKCSDLYLKVGEQPYISRYGMIYKVPTFEITARIWGDWAKYAISSEQNAKYVRQKMLDFSYTITSDNKNEDGSFVEYRYRVSAGFSLGKYIATFRMISLELPSFSTINFPKNVKNVLREVAGRRNKITMFCGVTGSGKTTTFASCINDFTKEGEPFDHSIIISLEDPIEYVFHTTDSVNILQKELGVDFKDFASGVKQALREHPNFVNVGETRDNETIHTLIEASRTGHACWTSFHSSDVADTLSRMYNMLINENQSVMYDLIANMNLILCQQLIPSKDGFQLITQYMLFTDDIKNYLNKQIDAGKNIPLIVSQLFKNENLLKSGILKDWS